VMSSDIRKVRVSRRGLLRGIGVAGLTTAMASLLAACQQAAPAPPKPADSSQAPQSKPAAAQPTAAPAAPSGAKAELRFLTITGEPMAGIHTELIDRFQKANPNIGIRFEQVPFAELGRKITTEAAGGNPPDVIWADGPEIKHLAYNNVIMPLEPWLYTKEELSDFVPSSIDEGSFNGTVHAIGRRQSCLAVWYNVDIMEKAGIKPPSTLDQGWTFTQWRDAWKEVTRPNGELWGVVGRAIVGGSTYEGMSFIRSAGEKGSPTYQSMSPDGKTVKGYLDTPEALAAFQFWQELFTKDQVTPQAFVPEAFETGKAASVLYPEALKPVLDSKYPNIKYAVSPLPYFKTGFSHTGSFMYVITNKTKYKDEAGAFVKFISNEENSRHWFEKDLQLPVRKSVLSSAKVYESLPSKLFMETLLNWGQPRPQTPAFREYDQLLVAMLNDIAKGAPVDDMVRGTVPKIDAALAKYA
jgi:fructooligosaccharide transport system substrate-binding protein